jgi:hypothetical protein
MFIYIYICRNCWKLNSCPNYCVIITNTQHKVYFAYLFLHYWIFLTSNVELHFIKIGLGLLPPIGKWSKVSYTITRRWQPIDEQFLHFNSIDFRNFLHVINYVVMKMIHKISKSTIQVTMGIIKQKF